MKASVIIPSYRRTADLSRCLAASLVQSRPFDEIIVVARRDDLETRELTEKVAAGASDASGVVRLVTVTVPGVIAAMQAGLDAASPNSDVICLTDDDAAPRSDWLERIVHAFEADPELGGVGGRDWQWSNGVMRDGSKQVVGKIQWFGRIIGNHHLGAGGPRDVNLLKGANCAFLAEPLRRIGFDRRLRGSGAQVHWEMAICLGLNRRQYRLIYDPAIAVDHYVSQRVGADVNHRGGFHAGSLADAVHNETLLLLEHMGTGRRVGYLLWAILVGTGECPGIVNLIRLVASRRGNAIQRWQAVMSGRYSAWRRYQQSAMNTRVDSIQASGPT